MINAVVSTRIDKFYNETEHRDSLDQALVRWLGLINVLAYPIPNSLVANNLLESWLEHIRPQAIVLSGGHDIGVDEERDLTELHALTYAKNKGLPLLGICRGLQSVSHFFGVPTKLVSGHINKRHDVHGKIFSLYSRTRKFNLFTFC